MTETTNDSVNNTYEDINSIIRYDTLCSRIQEGLEIGEILEEITAICSTLKNVISVKLFEYEVQSNSSQELTILSEQSIDTETFAQVDQSIFNLNYFDITLGKLLILHSPKLSAETTKLIQKLSYQAACALSSRYYQRKISNYENRLEVLNEVHQLISADIPLGRTIATLTRSIAFRFGADCAITFLAKEETKELQIKGKYGIKGETPDAIDLESSIFEKLFRFGGIISINDLKNNNQGLSFLESDGITSIHAIAIESEHKIQGTILIGYRKAFDLDEYDNDILEEFARGAAIALFRAESREQLRSYTDELEILVQSRTADLEIQTHRAEEANRAKSQFVANMSHELRTPLTAIVAYSNVMSDGILGHVNTKQKDALDAIFRSAQHLKELIDDVLDISKVEAGKTKPEPVPVSLFDTMTYVFKLMHQTAVGKGVKLHPYKLEDDVKLFVDPRQIRQALLNLISNAIKYTPIGGEVHMATEIATDKVKIKIIDSGVGIPQKDLGRLFERYERGSDNFSKDQKGTGIGLSLTKDLVELNNGKIGAESEFGHGSTFWILVPRSDELPQVEDAVNLSSKRRELNCRLDGLNILILDDNESTCDVLEMILTQVGANITIAYSVSEARKSVKENYFDAALVDLALPEENGIAFIDSVRSSEDQLLRRIPLIVVSACVFQSDISDAENAGASSFVAKPFQPQDLIEEIRSLTTRTALEKS